MLAVVLRERHAEKVGNQLRHWGSERVELHAPLLAQYEIVNGISCNRAHQELSDEEVEEALRIVDGFDIAFDLTPDSARALEITLELERRKAYDAAYLELAERLDAELWTLDGPLARNAGGRGYRVKLID
jgi:predicted nucleic acid-binding protein